MEILLLFVFLCCFDVYKLSKIAQIHTVKTFRRANTVKSSIFLRCVPFICHVVCTKNVLNWYASSSSETQGQLVGAGKSQNEWEKIRAKKSQEGEEEPLGTRF